MKLEIFTIGNQEKDFLRKRQATMEQSKADLVMLLNTDIVVSGFKQAIAHFKDPKLFAVTFSPRSSNTGEVKRVECANGGSSIYKRAIWNKIGGIDLAFEPYWFDDVDYSKRASDAGYHILEDGNIEVKQVSQMGTEIIKKDFHGQLIYWRNFFLYLEKHRIPMAKRHLLVPVFWPFIIWAHVRYNKFHGK